MGADVVVGAHLRNEAKLTPVDYRRFGTARFGGALIMWYQSPAEVAYLGVRPQDCVVRLPDSVEGRRIKGDSEWAGECLTAIREWHSAGYRLFQLDNEPNMSWAAHGAGQGAPVWAWLTRRMLLRLQSDMTARGLTLGAGAGAGAGGVELGLTPFANPKQSLEWLAACSVSEPGYPSVRAYTRFACCHCYWQPDYLMDNEEFGAGYEWVARETGLPVYITECGCSSLQGSQRQPTHYPRYIRQVRAGAASVRGLYFYLLGSNGDWGLFELTDAACASVGLEVACTC